ncbi:hypothetical protein [Azospirillum sp. sgz302134]
MAVRRVVAALGLGMAGSLLASCATGPDPQVARRAQTEMLGMPKERLLACAGVPARQAAANGREYYTYAERGPDYIGPGSSIGVGGFGGSSSGVGLGLSFGLPVGGPNVRTCEVTVVLGPGGVEQVSYPANADLSTCTPVVQNCVRPAPQ